MCMPGRTCGSSPGAGGARRARGRAGGPGHAVLRQTQPVDDAVVQSSPARVSLRFNEPVETAFGSVRVYRADATRVDRGDTLRADGPNRAVAVDGGLDPGTPYTVAWRVVSGDGHRSRGRSSSTSAGAARPGGLETPSPGSETPRSLKVAESVARGVDFGLLLLVVEARPIVLVLVLRRRPPFGAGSSQPSCRGLRARGGRRRRDPARGRGGRLSFVDTFRPSTVRDVSSTTRFGESGSSRRFSPSRWVSSRWWWRGRARRAGEPCCSRPCACPRDDAGAAGHASTTGTLAEIVDTAHVLAASQKAGAGSNPWSPRCSSPVPAGRSAAKAVPASRRWRSSPSLSS